MDKSKKKGDYYLDWDGKWIPRDKAIRVKGQG